MRILLILLLLLPGLVVAEPVTLTFSWDASATPNVTYNVYQVGGTADIKLNAEPIDALTYSAALDLAPNVYTYYVTAVNRFGIESPQSNHVPADLTIPEAPGALKIISVIITEG